MSIQFYENCYTHNGSAIVIGSITFVITQSCCNKLNFIHQTYNTHKQHTHTETQLHCYTLTTHSQSQSQSYFTTDGQSVSMSWCRAQFGTFDQRYYFFFDSFSLVLFGAPSLTRGRVCHLAVHLHSCVHDYCYYDTQQSLMET
jgi:hypothetical protein